MRTILLAAFWLLMTADDFAKRELDRYQGKWVLVSEEFEGKDIPAEKRPQQSYVVNGDKIVFMSNGRERSAFVKLDPSKKPKTYDLIRDDGLLSMNEIYTWDDGDTIKICAADAGGDRPDGFKTAPGSRNRIRVWKRDKSCGAGPRRGARREPIGHSRDMFHTSQSERTTPAMKPV